MTNFDEALAGHRAMVQNLDALKPVIETIGKQMIAALGKGGKIILMGNGGSAADSQHLAAEFVGRYQRERSGLPAIALTTDTSILTAVSNDYGFDNVFTRQIEALCRPEDVVVGISTSGNSPNVLKALDEARQIGAYTVGFTGGAGGQLAETADTALVIPAQITSRIQEGHILMGHILCDIVEQAFEGR